jgi:hypothetical protein
MTMGMLGGMIGPTTPAAATTLAENSFGKPRLLISGISVEPMAVASATGEEHGRQDRHVRQAAGDPAHQVIRETDQTAGDPAGIHQGASEHEEGDGHHGERVHPGEHSLDDELR